MPASLITIIRDVIYSVNRFFQTCEDSTIDEQSVYHNPRLRLTFFIKICIIIVTIHG